MNLSTTIKRLWRFFRDEHRALGGIAALATILTILTAFTMTIYMYIEDRVTWRTEVQYRLPTDEEVASLLYEVSLTTPFPGRVTTQAGDPLSGVFVRFCYWEEVSSEGSTERCGAVPPGESPYATRTEPNGEFKLGFSNEVLPALVVSVDDSSPVRVVTENGELVKSQVHQWGPDDQPWFSSVFEIPKLVLDSMVAGISQQQRAAATLGTMESPVYVERVRLFGDSCVRMDWFDRCRQETDAEFEFWLRNPTNSQIRVTNAGLRFLREDPGVLCCCVDDDPYLYQVDIRREVDRPGTWLEFTSPFVSIGRSPSNDEAKLQATCVTRQGCESGVVVVAFSTEIEIDAGETEKVRLVFPAYSDFRGYEYRTRSEPDELAEGQWRRSFAAYFFDEGGALVQAGG